jgi:hypothetical protein
VRISFYFQCQLIRPRYWQTMSVQATCHSNSLIWQALELWELPRLQELLSCQERRQDVRAKIVI